MEPKSSTLPTRPDAQAVSKNIAGTNKDESENGTALFDSWAFLCMGTQVMNWSKDEGENGTALFDSLAFLGTGSKLMQGNSPSQTKLPINKDPKVKSANPEASAFTVYTQMRSKGISLHC